MTNQVRGSGGLRGYTTPRPGGSTFFVYISTDRR